MPEESSQCKHPKLPPAVRSPFHHPPGLHPHSNVSVGLKTHSASGYTSHLLGATVQFLTEMYVVEVASPVVRGAIARSCLRQPTGLTELVDVDAVVELYGLPLTASLLPAIGWPLELKDRGNTSRSAAVKALRKPTTAAWLANHLVRVAPTGSRS